jgi:isopentenyl diphosphate isomerase/L-lactate dehydrogenase-like FMN-dependent dehydrogenase
MGSDDSTAGSQPIEDVGKVNGSGPRFFQLYLPHDDELAISLLTRAWKSGFDVCIMTLDTDQLAWRHQDIKTANYAYTPSHPH